MRLAWLVGGLGAVAGLGASPAVAATATLGLGGWQVQSSAVATQTGARISAPGFAAGSWLAVTPDGAGAPGTEITAELQSGACPQVFYSEDIRECFGYMDHIGKDTVARFAVPWWWRTTFSPELAAGQHAELIINGVVGQAALWVDGHELSGRSDLQGDYARRTFDISSLVHPGANAIAVEVFPNNPATMLTLDDVDWNQIPPDNNTGIQFPIQLHVFKGLSVRGVHVLQQDTPTVSSAALTLAGEVTNATAAPVTAGVTATITPPGGSGAPIVLEQSVTLAAHESRTVTFEPSAYPSLQVSHPAIWWPYQLGAQPLYQVTMSASEPGGGGDSESQSFGIRTVTSELVGPSPQAPEGVRRFLVNGRPIVIRGGGWSEDLFLRYSAADTATQIALIKNLGLNAIRTEGKEMPQDFYEQMDRAGILIDAGFQCCDAWQIEGHKPSGREFSLMELSARTIGEELRDHPSVLDFSWSDNAPTARQEKVSLRGFAAAGFQDPLISSAEYNSSRRLGPSGEKEGPYDWVPPGYWYDGSHYDPSDPTRTNVGGAWGFDSEASAGDTVPTEDSIRRFMSGSEQEALWREPAFNQYHTDYEPEIPNQRNGGYSFGTLYELDHAIDERYGPPQSLEQYVEEAQVANYETQRAEFEAYIDHADASPTPSTGIIYWMLNKGMPTLLWDLYNEEYDEAGSYFGAQEADRSVHALFAYDTGKVTLDNLTGAAQGPLTVTASVYSAGGTLLNREVSSPVTLAPQQVVTGVLSPSLPASTQPPTPARTYFVELLLSRAGTVIDRNTYWLSTQADEIDWPATEGDTFATLSQDADLRELRGLPAPSLSATASTQAVAGPDDSNRLTTVHVTDTDPPGSPPAFFVRADIRRGDATGTPAPGDDEVLPAYWSEDDLTLWPGETATVTVAYDSAALDGLAPVITLGAWNSASVRSIPGGESSGG